MALETDKTTEARRKALRNGEEDPVVVAQRFLNIYRQIHIFSPERKESFDKMLMELSPDIRGIFSSLPGGAMLQDYVDELAEKNGVEKAVHVAPEIALNDEAHQQAQILATALAKAQSQTAAPAVAPAVGGTAKLAIDKDFAGEFAKIISSAMQQQTNLQKESLEKLASDLSKTQLFIAKSMKDGREEQRQEFGELCKSIVDGSLVGREEQRQEMKVLCQTIAASHAAVSNALDKVGTAANISAPVSAQQSVQAYDDSATKQLIEVVLDGQKQINQRLDKVEEASLNRANDNSRLLEAFEKSQAEMIKSLSSLQYGNLPVKTEDDNDERLIRILGDSQEKLIKTLLSANLQQNNTAQSNNNANNIQINTADNSAQLMLLVDKIASLQATNEQNLEKAITKVVEEQSRLYDTASQRQTKELAAIIADGLKEGFKNLSQPVYMPQPLSAPIYEPQPIPVNEIEEWAEPEMEPTAVYEPEAVPVYQEEQETFVEAPINEYVAEESPSEYSEPFTEAVIEPLITEENAAPKKKKKKKKKNKNKTQAEDTASAPILTEQVPETVGEALSDESFELSDLPTLNIDDEENLLLAGDDFSFDDFVTPEESNAETSELTSADWGMEAKHDTAEKPTILLDDFIDESQEIVSGSDWGFGDDESLPAVQENTFIEPTSTNDNQEGEDWEWVYVEDDAPVSENPEEEAYEYMEAIGNNSYICSGNLYTQDKADNSPILYGSSSVALTQSPQILNDEEEEFVDPYQNSILKD